MVKLKASSLIEVIVSMTLASMVFSIGLMIYLNVVGTLPQGYKGRMLDETNYLLDSIANVGLTDEEFSMEYDLGVNVYYSISEYKEEDFPNSWLLTCTLEDSLGNTFEASRIKYLPQLDFE
ncbi:MAG: hypothetical protein AAFN93_17635 [Bacteroidota bacterium]